MDVLISRIRIHDNADIITGRVKNLFADYHALDSGTNYYASSVGVGNRPNELAFRTGIRVTRLTDN